MARFASLASQVIVGLFLSSEQVGDYALALGILGVTGIWRTGGTSIFLPSLRPEEFDLRVRGVFQWATCLSFSTAALTVGVALTLPNLKQFGVPNGTEQLPAVLLWLAVRAVAFPFALLGRMRLSVEHRFGSLARLDAVIALLRVLLTWIVAREGGGALALAIPYALSTVIELIGVLGLGGIRRGDFRPDWTGIKGAPIILAWPLAVAVLMSMRADISFLAIGAVVATSALGTFYFAFQLANQPTMLLASSLQNVLGPLLAHDRGLHEAERRSLIQVFAGAMLFVPITTLAVAAVFPSAERMLWGGKWADSTAAVYWLCGGTTYATVATIFLGPLLGLQRFRAAAGFELLKMIGVIGSVALGATIYRTVPGASDFSEVTFTAAAVSVGMLATALWQLVWIAKHYEFPASETLRHLAFGPALATLTSIASVSVAHSAFVSLGAPPGRWGALIEFAIVSATYLALILLAVRFTAEETLRDTVRALPAPISGVLTRAFGLR